MSLSDLIKRFAVMFFCFLIIGCGTLGGLDKRVFLEPKWKIESAIDSIYANNPKYIIPAKWEKYNDWSERGYDFLESRIFYFQSEPEEMYYVSFVGTSASPADTFTCTLAIRAVYKENEKRWYLENDLSSQEKQRIESRLDREIISKIEVYGNTKARRE